MDSLKLFALLCTASFVTTDEIHATHIIESPAITQTGSWGELESCPWGTFVTGMQLKVEKEEGWKDDTGLNGIRLFCSRLGQSVDVYEEAPVVISSSVGPYGEWKNIFRCGDSGFLDPKTAAVIGFQLRVEGREIGDDTGANNLRIVCHDLQSTEFKRLEVEGDGTRWGQWSESQLCREGYAICGIVTQIDHGQGKGYDDTGLNNIRAECCKIRFHNHSETEERDDHGVVGVLFPDPIESAKGFEKTLLEIQKERKIIDNSAAAPPSSVPNEYKDDVTSGFGEDIPSWSSNGRNAITLPEILTLEHSTTEDHAGFEEEMTETVPYSYNNNPFFGQPESNPFEEHQEIHSEENTNNVLDESVKPIVSPELESEIKKDDEKEEILNKINTTTTTSFPEHELENTNDDNQSIINNQLLVSSSSKPFSCKCISTIFVFIAFSSFALF